MSQNYGGGLWRYESDEIDVKTTGVTTIATTNPDRRFYPLTMVVEIIAATALSVSPTIKLGTNSATFDNILGATTPGITVNSAVASPPLASGVSIAPGTDIKANVTVAATGTSGTFKVSVFGYYG